MASTAAVAPADFATTLSNVRRLTSSSLPHQSKPAQLLTAIESAISSTLATSSSSTATLPHTSTAYFASLLQCLEKAVADEVGGDDDALAETENMGQGALIPATLYLLAIVVPETPSSVVLSKLSPLLECLLPLFESALEHPPALRSLLQVITAVILLSPGATLSSSPLLKRAFAYLLEMSLDPRPKVRHIAQEGVRKVLTTPVPPRLNPGAHPFLPRARDWVVHVLEEETKSGGSAAAAGGKKKARFADADEGEGKRAIWVIQGLRGWVAVWGDEHLSTLCSQLLALPPLPHLTPQIYSLLAHLLTPPPADAAAPQPSVLTNLPTIVDSLLSSPPDLKDNHVDVAAYLSAISSALVKMSFQDKASLQAYLPRAFNLMFNTILIGSTSSSQAVLSAAADAIGSQGLVRYCVSDDMILAAVNYHRQGSDQPGARKKQKTPFLSKVISSLEAAFRSDALKIPYLLSILTALVSRLRLRVTESLDAEVDETGSERTAAEELLMDTISEIGDLRVDKGFEHKAKVDEMLGMALEVVGVEGVLRALPLNIEPDSFGQTPQPGRAHLLPLIRSHVTNDSLAYFASYFRPLSERVFGRKVAAEDVGKGAEAKIWEIIVAQVWDCFPGFCEMPRDMQEGLTPAFLGLLTNLLYTQPLLLSSLLRGLSQLVSSTQTLLTSTTEPVELRKQFGLDQDAAKENMAFLKTLAKDMVSVLLNVFSKLPREQRGMVGDVIALWVGIMTEQDLVATYNTVTSHLSNNLTSTAGATPGASPISHTMLDLLIIFTPQLPTTQSVALFTATASATMLEHSDATVQKKSYRLLKRLIEAGKLGAALEGEKLEAFVESLNEVAAGVGPGAQRDRLQLLSGVVDILPKDRLHLIPELLSEAVLGTKEVNEKARDAGFDLLVVMGHKMAQGGTVKQSADEDEEDAADDQELKPQGEVEANVQEYITMVAAGLAGTTPHMISASINALSRLVFEFKDDISDEMISELVSTVTVFVASKNREIVKSALGFIKVAVVALPLDTVTPHLPALVPALLGWVHDHKNHFKTKTVHIFERMIRKFGYDEIIGCAPAEGGERKVLEGIKKKKDRAKRKKAGKADEDGQDGEKRKTTSGSAFDDILYNSDTDEESDEEDVPEQQQQRGKNGRPIKPLGKQGKQDVKAGRQQQLQQQQGKNAAFIRSDGDQPMDLLSRSIASTGITTADPSAQKNKRKPGQDASKFKTDKTGKLIFTEADDDDGNADSGENLPRGASGAGGDGAAFYAAQRGVDGQSRDAKGNVRFNKNNKRSREMEREDEDAMDLDELIGDKKKKPAQKKKKEVPRLGDEFRAKRAGGDIKREGGPDPYSYVSLGQASKRKGQSGRVALTNKKKGSRA